MLRGGGTPQLNRSQEARRSRSQSISVILNLFQDLLTGGKDAKRHRCKASIINNNSLSPCERAEFQCENGSSNIRNSGEGENRTYRLKHKLTSHFTLHPSLKRTYRPNVLTSYRLKRNAAFTLAEVLITLGIIGVVAAITIPTLISNHQKEVVGKRLQKFYSTMQNAFNFAMIDHGEMSYWEFPTKQNDGDQMSKFATTYIFPYLKGVSQCDTNSNPECFSYGSEIFDQGLPAIYIFSDGSCFGMNIGGSGVGAGNIHIYYDYNCMQKPNIYGKDVFDFIIRWVNNEYVFKAGGYATVNKTTREELLNYCKNAQNRSRGECASLIQFDGWQVKDDYPWL